MRAVWMPSERTMFEVDVEAVTRAIPSAKRVPFRFPEATAESRYGPELVSEMSVDFGKGRVLTVPGYMLWKFRDMIPAQLGDEQSGWADNNDFTPSVHGSALMERVRMAHDACCREGEEGEFFKLGRRVLVEVTVNLASGGAQGSPFGITEGSGRTVREAALGSR